MASRASSTRSSLATFASSRAGTISRASVPTGAPCSTAASPPTTANSTPPSCRARSAVRKLLSGIQFSDGEDRIHVVLQELEALRRRQREHPADQRQVDAIFAVIGLRLRIRFRHLAILIVYTPGVSCSLTKRGLDSSRIGRA